MTLELTGETALVTGSTSGIGRATAELLAERGAHVIVTGRDKGRGAATSEAIRMAGGVADFIQHDLSDLSAIESLVRQVNAVAQGGVDILVNNAGIYPFAPSGEFTFDDFDQVMDLNVKVPFFLSTALIPGMVERGHGSIINFSTSLVGKGTAEASLYSASKAAVEALTRVWAAEFGPSNIRVNTVSPGPTATEGTAPFGEGFAEFYAGTPAGQVGLPSDVAAAVAFLLSDEARHIHGIVLPVDGGFASV